MTRTHAIRNLNYSMGEYPVNAARPCTRARARLLVSAAQTHGSKQGVTHEEWVAARLKAAALVRAVEQGDPDADRYVLQIARRSERDEHAP